MDYQYDDQNEQGFEGNHPPRQNPNERNKYESAALTLGIIGFLLLLAGCCCNSLILIPCIIVDVAAIVVAILSRQTTGGRLTKTAKAAIIYAVISLALAFVTANIYTALINNEQLMNELYRIYEDMGYEMGY